MGGLAYDFNFNFSEEPDDVSSPTDMPARKEKIQRASSTNGNRKTAIEKSDSELEKLLQLESDIDEVTRNLQNIKRNKVSRHE